MYIHTEIQLLKCSKCGKEFEGYNSQNLKSYNRYCSLDCEYNYIGKNHKTRKHSLELKKLILQFSLDHEDISTRRIAKIFGVSKDMPSNIIKQYGNRKPKRLLKFDRDYFNVINTEEKAYWLGFIYADGCVTNNGNYALDITLKYSDIGHLPKFA